MNVGIVQETDISQWKVPDFFRKIDFPHEQIIKNRDKSLQLPYANKENFEPILSKLL